eukprot:TRINITY_DN4662_c0_g1_i1.p1 TRINITY_DN4662_c0_g1~~TRINITY_DN4662_c0_g1_i1.p1  ORF type:complete len:238 (+),score=27.61 TRINITY_DN4662_c0_g1_i1:113-826(+)
MLKNSRSQEQPSLKLDTSDEPDSILEEEIVSTKTSPKSAHFFSFWKKLPLLRRKKSRSSSTEETIPSTTRTRKHRRKPSIKEDGEVIDEASLGWEIIFYRKDLFVAFRDYLQKRLSSENLNFILEAELFEYAENQKDRNKMCTRMYHTYIQENASSCVNIDYRSRKYVLAHLDEPGPETFDSAFNCIYEVIENELWPQFLKQSRAKESNHPSRRWSIRKSDTISNYERLRKLKNSSR